MSILFTGAFIDLKEKENYMRGTNWLIFFIFNFFQSKFQFYSYGKGDAIAIIYAEVIKSL